ncbi:MAG: hypothetical protein WDZ35_09905 [Crocinitomicaceae bacterium]
MNDNDFQEELYQILDNQIADKDPKETGETLEKLKKMGMDESKAKELMASCLAIELLDVIEKGNAYNHERYVSNLKRLPFEPQN